MIAPHIETERLILREARLSDFDALSKLRAKEEIGRHTGGVRQPQEAWFMIMHTAGMWPMLGYGYWFVDLKETGELVGQVGFSDFKRGMTPDISGAPEAGWIIDTPYWGKGLMTEAVQAAHLWLDTKTDYQTSTCIIDPDHAPSIRVAEKCGYTAVRVSEYKGDTVTVFERHQPPV